MTTIIQTMGNPVYLAYLQPKLPEAVWVFDRIGVAFDTYLRALRAAGNKPSLHLEDDVVLTTGFTEKVAEAIEATGGDRVIQFFSMRKEDALSGSRWDSQFSMNQCTYMPAGVGYPLIRFSAEWLPKNQQHRKGGYDLMFREWMRINKVRYWIHVPSLVQHRSDPSNISPRSTRRQSGTFVDPWL